MKVFIAYLLVVLLLFSLGACGQSSNDPSTPSSSYSTDTTNNSQGAGDNTDNTDNTEVDGLLGYTFKVPGKSIFVDVPNYQEIDKGFTKLFILNGERYVAITYDKNSNASSVEEAHSLTYEIFKDNIQNYSYVNSLEIKKDSTETINGIQLYKFVGNFNCALDYSNRDNAYDAFAIGYSFIMDGIPCSIIGSVINQGQSEKDISEVTELVEAMIKTLRSER